MQHRQSTATYRACAIILIVTLPRISIIYVSFIPVAALSSYSVPSRYKAVWFRVGAGVFNSFRVPKFVPHQSYNDYFSNRYIDWERVPGFIQVLVLMQQCNDITLIVGQFTLT